MTQLATGIDRAAGRALWNAAACLRIPIPHWSHANHSRLFARCPHFQVNLVTGKPESRHGPGSESKPPISSREHCNLNASRSRENCSLATSGHPLHAAGALPTRMFSARLEKIGQRTRRVDSNSHGAGVGESRRAGWSPPAWVPRGPPGRARRGRRRRRRPEAPRVTMRVTRTEILSAIACTFRVSVGL